MTARLAREEVRPSGGGEPRRWIWLLHGVYGRGRNWRSVARRLVDAVEDRAALLVDLRLHGGSRGSAPPHTLSACADDLDRLAGEAGVEAPDVVLGHSLGGKVALAWARRAPEGLAQAWVVDASPSAGASGGSALDMLEALRDAPGPFADREEAVDALEGRGFPRSVGRWMATNLAEAGGGLAWDLDLEGISALLEDHFASDLWPAVEDPPPGLHLHLVKAEGSDVVPEEACRRIRDAGRAHGRAHLHRLAGDHWLNVSNPDGLLDLMRGRMPR